MKLRYQYIHFVEENFASEKTWSCRNNRTEAELGEIRWYAPWRQYCYFPFTSAVYSAGCLKDIADFIAQLRAV